MLQDNEQRLCITTEEMQSAERGLIRICISIQSLNPLLLANSSHCSLNQGDLGECPAMVDSCGLSVILRL